MRALVQRYQDQPFDILGVNTDSDKDQYRADCITEEVTWRSVWDGDEQKVCRAWGVSAFPTIYLIDAEGRIRFKDSRGAGLERDVATLMAELEGAAPEEAGNPGADEMESALQALGYLEEPLELATESSIEAALDVPDEELFDSEEITALSMEVTALTAEYEAADATWNEAWRAVSGKERRDLRKADPAADYLKRFEALADRGSGRAKLWLAVHLDDATDLRSKELGVALDGLYTELVADFAKGPLGQEIGEALSGQARAVERTRRVALLEALAANVSHRGTAAKALAQAVRLLESRKATDAERARGAALSERLLADYLDTSEGVAIWGNKNRGAFAGVGTKVPDFPAVDTEGGVFRISDYEGQVVLLDFWGFW